MSVWGEKKWDLRRGIKLVGRGSFRLKDLVGEVMRIQVLRGSGPWAMCKIG